MIIKKILILGSTRLTEQVVRVLYNKYELVGFVPSKNPTIEGVIDLPEVSINHECDIKLSIQYDKMVRDTRNAFNIHTGLLPNYGGTNILDYTLKNKDYEQGMTFHKMTEKLDYGPIISKISYPVLKGDRTIDLYKRLFSIIPSFTLSSLKLLENLEYQDIIQCNQQEPKIYKRGEFELNQEMKDLKNDRN